MDPIRISLTLTGAEADAFHAWLAQHGVASAEEGARRLLALGLTATSRARTVAPEDEARSGPEAPAAGTPQQVRARRTT